MRPHVLELILIAICMLIVLVRIWRSVRSYPTLTEDDSGLWRYHEDVSFKRKDPYGPILTGQKQAQKKELRQPVAVIHFNGDMRAKGHRDLAKLVDEIEINKDKLHGVVFVVSSPGGFVSTYGHAFSQLERIRRLEIDLTVCIDVVAASGGYLMSLPANRIVAAPFAMVGSVGVVAFVPNFRQLLRNWEIEPRTFTAGKYKRTVTLTDDATPEEIARFQSQLETVHRHFVELVKQYRPQAKLSEVETGEHWSAKESMELQLGLVDDLATSQEYLLRLNHDYPLITLSVKKGLFDDGFMKFSGAVADEVEERLMRLGSL